MKRKKNLPCLLLFKCRWIFVHFNSSTHTKQQLGGKYVTWQQIENDNNMWWWITVTHNGKKH
jgi:hypothetical protein